MTQTRTVLLPGLVRCGLVVAAAAYTGYLALLITCDLRRVAPLGFAPHFDATGATVAGLQPESIGSLAGLRPGDRIIQANGQVVQRRIDWQRVRVHLDPSKPLALDVDRGGDSLSVTLLLPSGLAQWRTGAPRPGLLAFRLAQAITLAFALLVMFKRQRQPPALLGALLLASIATVSLVLPMRLAAFWHALPAARQLPPVAALCDQRRGRPPALRVLRRVPTAAVVRAGATIALAPAMAIVAWHLYAWFHILHAPGPPIDLPDVQAVLFAVNVAYAVAAIGLLRTHQRGAESLTERRRIRVLAGGTIIGVAAGAAVVAGFVLNPDTDIFATATLTVLALVFLAVPAAFAYAILRHRLFDVSLIVRQGLRYALARRVVDALLPALALVLLADIVIHRAEPIGAVLQSRWWWFTMLGGALLVVRWQRAAWLESVDRRFFRERYDAQRLLGNIADQINFAMQFDTTAPSVMQQIEEALHPEFVCGTPPRARRRGVRVRARAVGGRSAGCAPARLARGDRRARGAAPAAGALPRRHRMGPASAAAGRTRAAGGATHRAAGADLARA